MSRNCRFFIEKECSKRSILGEPPEIVCANCKLREKPLSKICEYYSFDKDWCLDIDIEGTYNWYVKAVCGGSCLLTNR